jgi:alpha-beta hydrolase superfamily lysophospholipase
MKNLIATLALGLLSFSAFASCPRPWVCEKMKLPVPYTTTFGDIKFSSSEIRAGYMAHEGAFKGNVLYFEGLGDSMLNHEPLFKKITKAGYRVIAFDYMGQGGSSGRMNKTRIDYIPWIGERVWNKFAINTNQFPAKNIIGWSTGGLAAYVTASENKADKVILIAPGIAPKKIVGEGLFNEIPNEITLESLTTDIYFDISSNPHKEEIKPNSPLKVPLFSACLILTAKKMEDVSISKNIKGFVLLSGENDTYVNAAKTKKIISKNAPHFKIKSYDGALHEIDNERKEIRDTAHQDIIKFLSL